MCGRLLLAHARDPLRVCLACGTCICVVDFTWRMCTRHTRATPGVAGVPRGQNRGPEQRAKGSGMTLRRCTSERRRPEHTWSWNASPCEHL